MMKPLRPGQVVLEDWTPELARKLNRPVEQLLAEGLSAYDFSPAKSVEIRHPNGTSVAFKLAFSVVRPEKSEAAVFTEHDGYVEFSLVEDAEVVEISEDVYKQC